MRQLSRILVLLCFLAASPLVGASELADLDLTISVDSAAELAEAESQPFQTDIESLEDSPASTEELEEVTKIAEPGTLGLLALAGLMGGAVAMRRRLG